MSFKMDMSRFSKVSADKDHTILKHDDGHEIKINHHALSKSYRKQLEKLPMADGGKVPQPKPSPKDNKDKNGDKKTIGDIIGYPKKYADGGDVDKLIAEKEEVDAYNWTHEDAPVEYSKELQAKMEETDITPKKYAEGDMVTEEPNSSMNIEDQLKQPAPNATPAAQPPVIVNVNGGQPSPQPVAPQQPDQGLAQASQPSPQPAPEAPAQVPQINDPAAQQAAMGDAYNKQLLGAQQQTEAETQIGKEQAQILHGQAKAAEQMMGDYQKHFNELDQERKAFQQDIIDKHVDPNHYLGSMGSLDRIMTAGSLILGGLGAGLAGGGNAGLDFLNKQIDRDIEAQKIELGKKETLLSANLRQFGNMKDATEMTRMMMGDMITAKMKEAVAKQASPMAQAKFNQFAGQLEQALAPTMQQLAVRRALASGSASQETSKQDPANFVPAVVPKEHQEAVYKELERAQNTRGVAKTALENFDKVAKVLTSAGGLGRVGARIYEPAQLQALEAELGSTVGDMEGTVRETAMHNVKNAYLPRLTDTAARLAERRKELANYLKLKGAAPRAKSFGIDLDKFESTSKNPEASLTPQQQSFVKWARENPDNPKAKLVLKKLGLE